MRHLLWAIACLTVFAVIGCSSDYYARRVARREAVLAQRQQSQYAAEQARYAAEQQRLMEMCGNPQRAFERGHNEGLARDPMSTAWSSQCPPQYQQQQGAAYLQGYQQGASIAPAQVVMAPQPRQNVIVVGNGYGYAGGVQSCRFSSDCGPDMSCRNWGSSGQVCMGYGGRGAPCWFSSDCLSNSCDLSSRICR